MIVSDRKIAKTKPSDTIILITSSTTVKEQYSPDVNLEELADHDLLEPVEEPTISAEESLSTEENTPLAETIIKDRKQQIIEHVKQSSDNFLYSSVDKKKRNSQIREHLKNSLS